MSIKNNKHSFQKGFTLVEVAVIMPIAILVIGGLVGAIFAMTNNVLVTRADNNLVFNIQEALDKIETDVEISGGYLHTNNFTFVIGQGYDNTNTKFINDSATQGISLILNSYTTDKNPTISDRKLVYKEDTSDTCTASQDILMHNIVYFVDSDNNLLRRTIMPSDYKTATDGTDCTTPWQRPSCGTISTSCTAKDEKLLSGVDEFSVEYLDNANADVIDLTTATSIKVTIKANGKAGGKTFSESGTIRTSSPNNKFDS